LRSLRIVAMIFVFAALAGGTTDAGLRLVRQSGDPRIVTAASLLPGARPESAQIRADAGRPGPPISPYLLGALSPQEDSDLTDPMYAAAYASIPFALTPYGDGYFHWQKDIGCSGPPDGPGQVNYLSHTGDFYHLMTDLALPDHLAPEIHVAIGTNPTCDGRADPSEGAAWVNYANNVNHYHVRYWQIGYYPYDFDEPDFGPPPKIRDDPALYAKIVNRFSRAMTAVDPSISIGVAIQPNPKGPPNPPSAWDATVLSRVHPGYVVWPEPPLVPCCGGSSFTGLFDDHQLLYEAPLVVRHELNEARAELNAYNLTNVEIRPDVSGGTGQLSQQNLSITTTLYLGMLLGEDVAAGASETWEDLPVGGCAQPFTLDPGEYGLLNFAASALISNGLPNSNCPNARNVPAGTLFPPANAYLLASRFAHRGDVALPADVSERPDLRAYAATQGAGYAFMLFNLDKSNTVTATLGVTNTTARFFHATAYVYNRAIYDQVQKGIFAGPVSEDLGGLSNPFSISLTPWSMTVVVLHR